MLFQRESFSDELAEEMFPLLAAHWEEIAHYKDIKLEPDWEQYQKLDEIGMLRIYTSRTDEKTLIGYAVFFVKQNLHYKSSRQAMQDIVYISKERRGFGAKFIMWCDEQLKLEGVQAVYHHVKAEHNWTPLLEKLGYEFIDYIYGKRLDRGGE